MAVPALGAAKMLCEKSGWTLSNLELQKLLYIVHMYHLGGGHGPLINEHFEAWDYGPVVPVVYHRVKAFGSGSIKNVFHSVSDVPAKTTAEELLTEAVKQLGTLRPSQLVAITHWPDGAWSKYYEPGNRRVIIPNEDIRAEYDRRKEL